MTSLALVLATSLILGVLHAFDPDHLAAVTSFITRRPSAAAAAGFAARWGMGHSATLVTAGLATTMFRMVIPPGLETAAELAVGLMLIVVGTWALAGLWRGAPAAHAVAAHGHSIFWVGALHGLAGSAGLLVLIPVALMSSVWAVLAYILMFNVGVVAAMALYAMAIGGFLGRMAGGAGARWYPWLAGAAGSITVVLGLGWISLTLSSRLGS